MKPPTNSAAKPDVFEDAFDKTLFEMHRRAIAELAREESLWPLHGTLYDMRSFQDRHEFREAHKAELARELQLRYQPPADCPLHVALHGLFPPEERAAFMRANQSGLSRERQGFVQVGGSIDLPDRPPQVPAVSAARFDPLPLEVLGFFETITNPVERHFFFGKNKEIIQVGYRARLWAETVAKADIKAAAMSVKPGSVSAQLEAITEPYAKAKFYQENKAAIAQEFAERKDAARLATEAPSDQAVL